MSFNIKQTAQQADKDKVLLSHIRPIVETDCPLLLSILQDYNALTKASNEYERATCTLITAILQQERLYFALSRNAMRDLMIKDENLGRHRATFSNGVWPSLLAKFYNDFGLIKLIQQGNTRTASIFEVVHPELVSYLKTKIADIEKQKVEALAFGKTV
jgi:hypothetical protein